MFELYLGEMFVGVSSLILTMALALGWGKDSWRAFSAIAAAVCFLAGIFNVFGITVFQLPGLEEMLEFDPLFTLIRVALCISAFIVILVSIYTTKIEDRRKPEQCLFVVYQLLFSLILISSNHLLISFVCIGAMSVLSSLMIAMPFRNKVEGEAAIKYWFQFLPLYCMGFGALVVTAFIADSLHYSTIRQIFVEGQSGGHLVLFSMCILPFWSGAGIFPFHLSSLDANHGSSWPSQACTSLVIQPAILIALVRVLMKVGYMPGAEMSQWLTKSFAVFGLVGALWGLLGAITQSDSKRFFACFSFALWSICLIPIWDPSEFSLTVLIFQGFTVSISLSILFLVLSAFHEQRQSDELSALQGVGRRCIWESIVVLAALCSLAGLPPFVGFPSVLSFIGVFLEKGRIWAILPYLLCTILILVNVSRIVKILYFERLEDSDGLLASVTGLRLFSLAVSFALVLPLIGFGLYWDSVMRIVFAHAKQFLG